MIRPTRNAVLDDALRALRNALVKCDGTADRRIARNNARSKALAALRRMRKVLDETYPPIRLVTSRKRLKTTKGRLERLRRAGWRDVFGETEIARYASYGIPIKRVKLSDEDRSGEFEREYFFAPAWAVAIGLDHPTQLRQAKRSVTARRAAIAAEVLR